MIHIITAGCFGQFWDVREGRPAGFFREVRKKERGVQGGGPPAQARYDWPFYHSFTLEEKKHPRTDPDLGGPISRVLRVFLRHLFRQRDLSTDPDLDEKAGPSWS